MLCSLDAICACEETTCTSLIGAKNTRLRCHSQSKGFRGNSRDLRASKLMRLCQRPLRFAATIHRVSETEYCSKPSGQLKSVTHALTI